MADHDESFIDKVKDALGMGNKEDHRHQEADREGTAGRGTHDDLDADRAEGWAGVPDAAGVGGDAPRSGEGVRDDAGLHTARSGAEADYRDTGATTGDQFAGSGYDTSDEVEERAVTSDSPGRAAGTGEDGAWTRGEAASGNDPLVQGQGTTVEEERRESGL